MAEEIEAKKSLLSNVVRLEESNRCCACGESRLGIVKPRLYAMQVRAIIDTAVQVF